jgi:hypothetical protein
MDSIDRAAYIILAKLAIVLPDIMRRDIQRGIG